MKISTKFEGRITYAFFVAPALCLYLFVMAFPAGFSIWLSLTNYIGGAVFGNPNIRFNGLRAYQNISSDQYFYMALRNNLLIVLISVFGQIPLGFCIAYIINRGLIKGRGLFQTIIYLPQVISAVIIGVLFNVFFLSS